MQDWQLWKDTKKENDKKTKYEARINGIANMERKIKNDEKKQQCEKIVQNMYNRW